MRMTFIKRFQNLFLVCAIFVAGVFVLSLSIWALNPATAHAQSWLCEEGTDPCCNDYSYQSSPSTCTSDYPGDSVTFYPDFGDPDSGMCHVVSCNPDDEGECDPQVENCGVEQTGCPYTASCSAPMCGQNNGCGVPCGSWYPGGDCGCDDPSTSQNECTQPLCPDGATIAPGGDYAGCPRCPSPNSDVFIGPGGPDDCPTDVTPCTGETQQIQTCQEAGYDSNYFGEVIKKKDSTTCVWYTDNDSCRTCGDYVDPGACGSVGCYWSSEGTCVDPGECEEPLTRTDETQCPGGQTGTISWKQDKSDYPSCSFNIPPADEWYETGRTCDCPAGTTWSTPLAECIANTSSGLSVISNLLAGSWTISPGSLTGSGYSGSYVVTPASGGTIYTLAAGTVSGYSSLITNSGGTGASMSLTPGDSKSFTITYSSCGGGGCSFNYSLSNAGGSLSIPKGGGNQRLVQVTLNGGATQPVTLSLSSAPALPTGTNGISYSFSPGACSPNCTSAVNFVVSQTASTGTYNITVTGSPLNKTTSFSLIVTASSSSSVTCSPSAGPYYVGSPITWTASASGGTAPYTYSWSGTSVPSGSAGTPFAITYQTIGSKTLQVTARDSTGAVTPPANCTTGTGDQLKVLVKPTFQEF
jgi:hypothetical protein